MPSLIWTAQNGPDGQMIAPQRQPAAKVQSFLSGLDGEWKQGLFRSTTQPV